MNIFAVIEERGAGTDRDQKSGTLGQQPVLGLFTTPLSGLILPRLTIPRLTRNSVLQLDHDAGTARIGGTLPSSLVMSALL